MRILIDKDGVLYDLYTPWLAQHNRDYPEHVFLYEHMTWTNKEVCSRNNCAADIYEYFHNPDTWLMGRPIQDSQEITRRWVEYGYELGIVTTVANSTAAECAVLWCKDNYSHIPHLVMVNGHIKHWVSGDVLIDDAPHNLCDFEGIRLLYDAPWNKDAAGYIRVKNWQEIAYYIKNAYELLQHYPHYIAENMLKEKDQDYGWR